jgi:hypothetical protein
MLPLDLFIAYVPWKGGTGGKRRPVIIMSQNDKIVSVFSITSQYINKSAFIRSYYFPITDWKEAGLNKPSFIDTIDVVLLSAETLKTAQPIGRLTQNDINRFGIFLAKSR